MRVISVSSPPFLRVNPRTVCLSFAVLFVYFGLRSFSVSTSPVQARHGVPGEHEDAGDTAVEAPTEDTADES